MTTTPSAEVLRVYAAITQVQGLLAQLVSGEADPKEIAVRMREVTHEAVVGIVPEEEAKWLTPAEQVEMYAKALAERVEKAKRPGRAELDMPWTALRQKYLEDPYYIVPLEAGFMALMSAPDGMGKTLFAEQVALHWAQKGFKVGYVHLELSPQFMLDRMVGRKAGMSYGVLSRGPYSPDTVKKIKMAYESIDVYTGGIYYLHAPGDTAARIVENIRRAKDQYGLDAVIIDYFNLIRANKENAYNVNVAAELSYTTLKDGFSRIEIPAMVIAQMTKAGKREGKMIDRHSIMGPSAISNASNLVVLLNRERLEEEEGQPATQDRYSNIVDVYVDKQTAGIRFNTQLYFDPKTYMLLDFRNASTHPMPPEREASPQEEEVGGYEIALQQSLL